jgi:hypothetical protein
LRCGFSVDMRDGSSSIELPGSQLRRAVDCFSLNFDKH